LLAKLGKHFSLKTKGKGVKKIGKDSANFKLKMIYDHNSGLPGRVSAKMERGVKGGRDSLPPVRDVIFTCAPLDKVAILCLSISHSAPSNIESGPGPGLDFARSKKGPRERMWKILYSRSKG